jgi:hypothetical protein
MQIGDKMAVSLSGGLEICDRPRSLLFGSQFCLLEVDIRSETGVDCHIWAYSARFCQTPSPILPFAAAIASLAKFIGRLADFCQPH